MDLGRIGEGAERGIKRKISEPLDSFEPTAHIARRGLAPTSPEGFELRRLDFIVALCGLFACVPYVADAQSDQSRVRVGVVLSGGSAKGLAHVGVLRVLEREGIPIDVVTGTSMGALVGGLYATGYSADSLSGIVGSLDWDVLLSDRVERADLRLDHKDRDELHMITLPIVNGMPSLPRELVAGQKVSQTLSRLTWPVARVRDFSQLPIPFSAVGVDLETGDAVRLSRGVLARAMNASMALPGMFAPVTIDGRTLIDGGLVRNLPAHDAELLGADFLICSDVSAPLKSADSLATMIEIVSQSIGFLGKPGLEEELDRCDILIEPDIEGLPSTDFKSGEAWGERGERATEAVVAQLREQLDRRVSYPRTSPPSFDSVHVDEIEFEGIPAEREGAIGEILSLDVPGWLTADRIDVALDRVFAVGVFDKISYSLHSASGRTTLAVQGSGAVEGKFGFGARFESQYKASILLSATLNNVLGSGSAVALDARLGEQLLFAGSYRLRWGPSNALLVGLGGDYKRVPLHLFEDDLQVAEARSIQIDGIGYAGVGLGSKGVVGAEIKLQHARNDLTVSAVRPDIENRTFYTLSAVLEMDTRNSKLLPERGIVLSARGEIADSAIGSAAAFRQLVGRADAYLPLNGRISIMGRAHVGWSDGDDLPPHYQFFVGGSSRYFMMPDQHVSFHGLKPHQLRGQHVQLFGLGAQIRVLDRSFVQFEWNTGTALEEWEWGRGSWSDGYGFSLATRTLGGVLELTLAGSDLNESLRLEIELGFPF